MEASGYLAYKTTSKFVEFVEKPWLTERMGRVEEKTVLDLGCGWGFYTLEIAKRCPRRLIAVDPSPSMLKQAEKTCAGYQIIPEFRLGSHRLLSDYSNQVDVLVANMLFPFAANLEELAQISKRISDCLRPGGRMLGFIPNVDHGNEGFDQLQKFGFSCDIPDTIWDGTPATVHFYDSLKRQKVLSSPFHCFTTACIERSLKSFGIQTVEFLRPKVSQRGMAELNADFWDDLTEPPKVLLVEAEK